MHMPFILYDHLANTQANLAKQYIHRRENQLLTLYLFTATLHPGFNLFLHHDFERELILNFVNVYKDSFMTF